MTCRLYPTVYRVRRKSSARHFAVMPATRSAIISIFIISCLFSLALITLYLNFGSEECHEGSFLCTKSDVCISNKYKCNHFRDCVHGEDEDPLTCADLHGGIAYYGNAVNLSSKNETEQPEELISCALIGHPAECDCIDGTKLRCHNVLLTEVPKNISKNMKHLVLSNISLELSNDSFIEYDSLRVIQFKFNGLSRIPSSVFINQNQLKFLHLLHNNLKLLEKNAFNGLDNVKNIFLDHNYLEFLNLNTWPRMNSLAWLDLRNNLLTFKDENFPSFKSLTFLHIQWNRIEMINEFLFQDLPNLRQLNLSHNLITMIHRNAFRNTTNLVDLNLTYNRITTIIPEILLPLILLNKLALGNNPITRINSDIFRNMKNLSSLDLNGISKEIFETTLFDGLKQLEFLYLKEFYYCVLYAKCVSVCLPNTGGLSTSVNLLPKSIFRWTLWIITALTLIMNALVLYGRMFSTLRDENQAINFVIRNLAVADLFMVVYLVVIGYFDIMYMGKYYMYAHEWESSNICTTIGITAVVSSEVSMLILVFLSLERFLLIAVPLSGYQVLKLKTAVYSMASIWLIGTIIAVAPLVLWKHSSKFYGSNGFCYPLYIEDPYVDGWQYSAFMFLGLHTSSLLLMTVLYALMFISVRETRQATQLSAGDFDFAVRFFFIVLANCLCWLPVIILKFAALKKFHISSKMYGWLIIFIVPINALVNPLLYTFTTPKYRSVITLKNIFKTRYQDSNAISVTEMDQLSLFMRILKRNKNEIKKQQSEKSNTQESSFETTNGEPFECSHI